MTTTVTTHPACRGNPRPRIHGLSLVEVLCVSSVLMTALSAVVPNMRGWQLQHALQATAAELETDIHYARSEAVNQQRTIRLDTEDFGRSSCHIVHTGAAHECSCVDEGHAVCNGNAQVLRLTAQRSDGSVRIASTKVSIAFDPLRGTITPTATLRVIDSQGRAIHQVVNIMGRVRSCSPNGGVGGFKPC